MRRKTTTSCAGGALALTALGFVGAAAAQAPPRPMSAPFATNAWFSEAARRCWRPGADRPAGEKYVAIVAFRLAPDGALAAPPTLERTPPSPAWRPFAQSALQAVKDCAPYHPPGPLGAFARDMGGVMAWFDPDITEALPRTPLKP